MRVPLATDITELVMFFDGACFPKNPGGTLGAGIVIYNVKDFKIKNAGERYVRTKYSSCKRIYSKSIIITPEEYGSKTTCNIAEYMAFKHGIEWITDNIPLSSLKKVFVFGDSMLVIKQMNDEWSINGEKPYSGMAIDAMFSLQDLKEHCQIEINWIPREKNAEADLLSNPDQVKGNWEK